MMSPVWDSARRWAAIACLAILAACSTQTQQAMHINVYHILFDTDSHSISVAGQQVIDQAASVVGGNKATSITIVGRTDATGSIDYNRQLSAKRAAAVHDALIATGQVAPDQIAVAWAGEKQQNTGPFSGFPAPGDRVVDIYIQ
jgi:outer membrane protein OmpA-like peptidoglycan-associated protein